MNGYFLYPVAAILMITIFVITGVVATGIISFSERLRNKRKKIFVAGRYNSYYKNDYDILCDERAKRMLPVIGRGYKQDLEDYMTSISEDRLPPCVVLNWVRSISEDLSQAALPVVNVKKWHQNMILLSSDESVATQADSIDLTNYEECFIWGCIVRWLDLFENNILDDDLKNEIFQVACPKRYLKPYYNITSMTQEEKSKIADAILKSGNVSIAQLSIGDNNTFNYTAGEAEGKKTREVTPDDVVTVIKSGRVILPTDGSITVLYAVCRDVYNWDMGQADFERAMSIQGISCKGGTISNTLRKHPYMREHVDKWAVLGAKEEILKVRDSFIEAMNLLPSSQS